MSIIGAAEYFDQVIVNIVRFPIVESTQTTPLSNPPAAIKYDSP